MDLDTDRKNAVALTKLKQLNKTNLNTQISNVLLAFLCYFLFKNELNHTVITNWILTFTIIVILRSIVPYLLKDKYLTKHNALKHLHMFRIGIFINALMWGIACLGVYPYGNMENVFYFVFIIMGVVSGASLIYSIDKTSAFFYPIIILIPLIYNLSIHFTKNIFPILFGTILYFIFVLVNIRKISHDRENFIISTYEIRQKEREKASSEERYRLLLNHSPIGIVHYDMDLKASYYNQQFIDIMGIDLLNLKTIKLNELKDQNPINSAKEALKGNMTEYSGFYEMSFTKRVLWINVLSSPVKDLNNHIVGGVSIIQDITEQKDAENKIKKLAFYDPLTRLPNRRMFIDKLEQILNPSNIEFTNGAIMFLDLDYFKSLNDTLGHDYGDMLLKEVAIRLKNCIEKNDMVSRFGGDEFVILIDGKECSLNDVKKNSKKIAKRILKAISEPFDLLDNKHTTTGSIGVVIFDKSADKKDLLKYADIAMYQAKKSGRNIVKFFDQEMQHEIKKQVSLESELKDAIKNREFILHYQPQVHNNGKIYGVEALVRWQHPKKGLIYPNEFILFSEDKGYIVEIGNQVLQMAFEQIQKWQRYPKMKNINVSINISAPQFEDDNFMKNLLYLIKKYKINTHLIKLEITESALLRCSEKTIKNMLDIRQKGIRFSLDDFGIGYSSLFYLKKLPIDELKIDQTFVRDIAIDSSDYSIIKTIIAIANSFEFDLIAEGVETHQQRKLLLKLNCDNFQGYLFSQPIGPAEVKVLIEENSTIKVYEDD